MSDKIIFEHTTSKGINVVIKQVDDNLLKAIVWNLANDIEEFISKGTPLEIIPESLTSDVSLEEGAELILAHLEELRLKNLLKPENAIDNLLKIRQNAASLSESGKQFIAAQENAKVDDMSFFTSQELFEIKAPREEFLKKIISKTESKATKQEIEQWLIEYQDKQDGYGHKIIDGTWEIVKIDGEWKVNVNGGVNLAGDFTASMIRDVNRLLTEIPVSFHEVTGNFYCNRNQLTSLRGAPQTVGGIFYCSDNQLNSLEGAPQTVGGDFVCYSNQLASLEGAPTTVGGGFWCNSNKLATLKGAPLSIDGEFSSDEFSDDDYRAYIEAFLIKQEGDEVAEREMTNYYVSDSRTLDFSGPFSLKEAEQWLDNKCIQNGMEAGDWKHPEYWGGSEVPPQIYTEQEWREFGMNDFESFKGGPHDEEENRPSETFRM